ncbi:rRNA-processing protein CGR1 [Coffea eugenioides]|uniref:rRNA-processing protein CGR1 n=1 Tax=Coffea eugenioides TaxID=49369 RepID=UPI000F60A8BB|nr:rRNA-processing protein CGR1 [Coffea eugenioides]
MACHIDFRCLDEGFGGKTLKRKRSLHLQHQNHDHSAAATDDMELEDFEADEDDTNLPSNKRQAVTSSDNPNKPVGLPTSSGSRNVSGRNWKQVRTLRASARNASRKRSTTAEEQRKREREIKKAYQERMKELKEEIRQNKAEKRKKREEREKRKQDNILRSGTKLQKITNPKTLKKISKSAKQRKLLKLLPDADPPAK